jgi:hypothetical protein
MAYSTSFDDPFFPQLAHAMLQTAFKEAGVQDYGGEKALQLAQQLGQGATVDQINAVIQQQGLRPFSGMQDFQTRNTALPGHNESLNAFNPVDIASGIADVGGELLNEPGFLALAGTAAGGSMLGGPAGAPSAAAGGTLPGNAALMSMGTPISAAELTSLGFDPLIAQLGTAGGAAGTAAYGGMSPATAGASVPTAPGVGAAAPAAATAGTAASGGLGGIGSLLSSPTALGMAGGALLGGLGGSQQAGTVTVEEGLPDWLKAYAKPALDKYSTDLQNYQIDPYGVMPSAMKEFQKTIGGQYLDPSTNKYLEDYFKLGAERIKGSLSPSFGHMQAFGQHSGYNESLSRGLGDFATGLYGGNYAKERDRQTQLTASAPAFIGQSSQAAFQPYQQYLGTVGSLGKKKDEPYFENPFGNILGGALAGGSLGRIWG